MTSRDWAGRDSAGRDSAGRDWRQSDEDLLAQIKIALVEEDVVVDRMREAAKAAFSWRQIDDELERLTLSADSLLHAGSGVRGDSPEAQIVEFKGEHLTVELEIGTDSIIGQVYPIQVVRVVLITPGTEAPMVETNEVGGFVIDRPKAGPCRIRIDANETGSEMAITDWMMLT